MSGSKLSYACKAARFLASELTSRDRLEIVSFDDESKSLSHHNQYAIPTR
jgi:Ca-activated chloride channel family protein